MARFSDLPLELAEYIVTIAARDGASSSRWLAVFACSSRAIWTVVAPILYENVVIRSRRACSRLSRACSHPHFGTWTRTLLLTIPNEHVGSSAAVDRLTRAFEHVRGFGGPFGLFTRFVYTRPAFRPVLCTITTPCTLTGLVSAPFLAALAPRTTHLHVFLDPALVGGGLLNLAPFGLGLAHAIVELPGTADGATMVSVARILLSVPTLQRLVIRKGSIDNGAEWAAATDALREFVAAHHEPRVWLDDEPSFVPFHDHAPRATLDAAVWGTGRHVRRVLYI